MIMAEGPGMGLIIEDGYHTYHNRTQKVCVDCCVYEVAPVPSKQPFGEREKGNDWGQAETSFFTY